MPDVYCEPSGKIGYPTRNAASKARAAFKGKFKSPHNEGGELVAFKCDHCTGWHLGRITRGRKRRHST